jgi:hypothetical protein
LRHVLKQLSWVLAAGLCVVTSSVGFAGEAWPIVFLQVSALVQGTPLEEMLRPASSQPEGFDPAQYKSLKAIPPEANFQGMTTYWTDTKPYTLKEYYFDTDDEPSYVLEVKEAAKRHALYTMVDQYRFSPDHKTLLVDNLVKQPDGKWQPLNRIIDVASKKTVDLHNYECSQFFATAANTRVVTYGLGTRKADDSSGPPRVVCIWDMQGKLQQALSVPLQNTLANSDASPNLFGLLPSEESTFYQLAYADGHCVLRLQNLAKPDKHRQIQLPTGVVDKDSQNAVASGDVGDPCEDGISVEIDLGNLKLAGGSMRFRTSKGGRGDLDKDWTEWKNYD